MKTRGKSLDYPISSGIEAGRGPTKTRKVSWINDLILLPGVGSDDPTLPRSCDEIG